MPILRVPHAPPTNHTTSSTTTSTCHRAISPFLAPALQSALSALPDSQLHPLKPDKKAYADHTERYHTARDEDIFPLAYYSLVHCPVASIFDTLLELEQNYTAAIQELHVAGQQALEAIHQRHARESEPADPGSYARHIEEIELFQASWQSDLLETQETQRREYREFVVEVYKEYQKHTAADDHPRADKIDGKAILHAAAEKIRQDYPSQSRPRQSSITSQGSLSHRSATSLPANIDSRIEKMIHDIQEMGFGRDQAEAALMLANNNMEQAVMLLIEDPQKVMTAAAQHQQQQQQQQQKPGQSTSTPYKRSSSLSQVQRPTFSDVSSPAHSRNSSWNDSSAPPSRRQSLQRMSASNLLGSPPNTGNNGSPSASAAAAAAAVAAASKNGKSWSPVSFLQQQKQVMESTNLSSVRKLGGWLGRAMENLGIDHDEVPALPAQQQPVESFTITLGTAQIKSTHNLRLLVTDPANDIFNPLPHDPTREMAYKAQTATKLYTSHLGAAIVLVELGELARSRDQQGATFGWRQYRSGKGSNEALFQRCQSSTEFHFPNIESQLTRIEADFEDHPVEEGSFFITRHSNLPLTQVVFHLVVDNDGVLSNLSNRHKLIMGLRNILRLTTRYDIAQLSIPLLLLPERFLEQPEQHFPPSLWEHPQQQAAWLQKRGEAVMKCVKGFLIENSRSGKRSQGVADRADTVFGDGLRNVEFLLPNHTPVYGAAAPANHHHPSAENASEYAFQQFRTLLVNLFRTS